MALQRPQHEHDISSGGRDILAILVPAALLRLFQRIFLHDSCTPTTDRLPRDLQIKTLDLNHLVYLQCTTKPASRIQPAIELANLLSEPVGSRFSSTMAAYDLTLTVRVLVLRVFPLSVLPCRKALRARHLPFVALLQLLYRPSSSFG